jgi:hypothetical protein
LWEAFPLNPTSVPLHTVPTPTRAVTTPPAAVTTPPAAVTTSPRAVPPAAPPSHGLAGIAGRTSEPVARTTPRSSADGGGSKVKLVLLLFGGFAILAVVALVGIALVRLPLAQVVAQPARHGVGLAQRTPGATKLIRQAHTGVGRRTADVVQTGKRLAGDGFHAAWSAHGAASAASLLAACLAGVAIGLFVTYLA